MKRPSDGTTHLLGFDILRAVAVSLVLLEHIVLHSYAKAPDWLFNVGRIGNFAVCIFLVLSGYLIGGIVLSLGKQNKFIYFNSLKNFWQRRWLRTLPLYYLYLFINLNYVRSRPQSLARRWEYSVFLQNLTHGPANFFILSWSLATQELFYLLFPLLLWLLVRQRKQLHVAMTIVIVPFLILPVIVRIFAPTYSEWWPYDYKVGMVSTMRMDSLMYGMAAVSIREFLPTLWRFLLKITPLSALFAIGICVYIYLDKPGLFGQPYSGSIQVIYFSLLPFSAALLLPFFAAIRSQQRLWAKAVTYLSLLSYSIYLGNILVIVQTNRFIKVHPGLQNVLVEHGYGPLLSVYVILTLSLATLTYWAWEKPFLMLRDRLK